MPPTIALPAANAAAMAAAKTPSLCSASNAGWNALSVTKQSVKDEQYDFNDFMVNPYSIRFQIST
jgi:hypothetical protein